MENEDSPMENEDSPMENEDSPKENEDSQDWRQWHILPMTILSADYRCFDLCRLIIANAILSIESEKKQEKCLKKLSTMENNAEAGSKSYSKEEAKRKDVKKCHEKYESVDREKGNLKESLRSKEFIIDLCRNANGRFESLIQGEGDDNEESFRHRCEDEQFFEELRSRVAEREYKKFKYMKIQRLADLIKARQTIASQLIAMIENKKIDTYALDIDLKFNPEFHDLVEKIRTRLEEKQDPRDVRYALSDHIPKTTLTSGDNAVPCLDQILTYRNKLAHPSGEELDIKKLYEEDATKSFFRLPYINFLHCVDFKKYFPADLLEEKVEYFLYPLTTAAEVEKILNNYKKLIDELDNRKQAIAKLEVTVKDLRNKGEEELSCVEEELTRQLEELSKKDKELSQIKDDYKLLETLRTKDKTLGKQILLSLKTLKRKLEPNQPKEVKECMTSIRLCAKEIEMGTVPPEGDTESDSDTENESDEVVEDDITSAGLHQRMEEDTVPPNHDRNSNTESGSEEPAIDVTPYQEVKGETGSLTSNSGTEGDREEQGASHQILKVTPEMVNEGTMLQTEDSEDSEA